MGFWKKLFEGRSESANRQQGDARVCDFCSRVVKNDDQKTALIKGDAIVAQFAQKINCKNVRPPSLRDPKDGLPVSFACERCLTKYQGTYE